MSRFNTTVYNTPLVETHGNGLIELVDPEDEFNVIVVMDVEEAEILLDDLAERITEAAANRKQLLLERSGRA